MKQWLQNQLAVAHQQARGIDPMLCQSRASAEELGQRYSGYDYKIYKAPDNMQCGV